MVKRIRIDADTVQVFGMLYADGCDVPAAMELEVTGAVSVRTVIPSTSSENNSDEDGFDLPFLIAPVTTSQVEADALSVVWACILAALHDDELVKLTRQGALTGDQRVAVDRTIVRALRAKSAKFSRPEFAALKVRISNAARNVEELAKLVSIQADAVDHASDRRVDDGAKGASRTAADAMAALVQEMDALDRAASLIKGKAGGAPRKAWRDRLVADLADDLSLGGDLIERIAEAACDAVDVIDLGVPGTIVEARKNLREKS